MYNVSAETRRKVCEIFGRTEEMVTEDIRYIKTWMKTQPHLPEIMEDVKIRNFLQLNKFDISKTQERIDAYYTIRSKIPDFFDDGNPKLPNIQRVFETTHCSTHPNAIDGVHRVILLRYKESNVFQPTDLIKLCLSIFEIRLFEDCMMNDIIVFDLANLSLKDATKITPRFVIRCFSVYKNVFSLRLKALYFLNSPLYVSMWMAIMKLIVKQKIFDRVQVHRDTEVLKELFPIEQLPKDYGGEGPSLDDLNEMMKEKIAEYEHRFDKMDNLRVNESLRPKKC